MFENVNNPEMLLKAVLDINEVPVQEVSADAMPFVCALDCTRMHVEAKQKTKLSTYRLKRQELDCHPSKRWTSSVANDSWPMEPLTEPCTGFSEGELENYLN
eukprot:gnl/MRDRNA2_/MRDRNA2_56083_c0_seq1.p3 gnl/MRDRNA2_/MRDRNA2_56083_c0~~gnl/MRDRNA2_/MRDRNA2_56083_c0_seq1.p3  ORF type:complete len:102 (+),score=16.68 gnl/MRDRNA2_/MRDRNA2_56083_c0_seq1:738-1043(+)